MSECKCVPMINPDALKQRILAKRKAAREKKPPQHTDELTMDERVARLAARGIAVPTE